VVIGFCYGTFFDVLLCRRIEFVLVLSVCLECRYLVHLTNTRDGQYHGLTASRIVHEESLLETNETKCCG